MDAYAMMDEADDMPIHSGDEEEEAPSQFINASSVPLAPSTNIPTAPTTMEDMVQTIWEGMQRMQIERDEEKKEKERKQRRKAGERLRQQEDPFAHTFAPAYVPAPTPTPTDQLDKMRMRQLLTHHPIPTFEGKQDLEALAMWQSKVEHFCRLAGRYTDLGILNEAWRTFGPEPLEWFTKWIAEEHGVIAFPPFGSSMTNFPFTWQMLKVKMAQVFTSQYANEKVKHELKLLKRGKDISDFHQRFEKLLGLLGQSSQTTDSSAETWNIYLKKMTIPERTILNSACIAAEMVGSTLYLKRVMTIVEQSALQSQVFHDGPGNPYANINANTAGGSSSLLPGPMELGATSASWKPVDNAKIPPKELCGLCGGRGHWNHECPTPKGWKSGDTIKLPPKRDGAGGRGGRGGRGGSSGKSSGRITNAEVDEKKEEEGRVKPEEKVEAGKA
jgi:hypothetical protein